MGDDRFSTERAEVAEAIRRLGCSEVARRIGFSNEATLRFAGAFGSQSATEEVIASRVARLRDSSRHSSNPPPSKAA